MKLVSSPEWLDAVPDAAPRYSYDRIDPPSEVSFRYIAIRHHADGGMPDYLSEVLADTDIFVPELPGWSDETAKRVSKVSQGDYKARERLAADGLWLKAQNPGAYEYNNFVFKALYNSRVSVALVDMKKGFEFSRNYRDGLKVGTPTGWEAYRTREQLAMENLCVQMREIREKSKKLSGRPVRVAMTYGLYHLGIADGLRIASIENGADFQVSEEFEDSLLFPEQTAESETLKGAMLDYQNWLRADEVATS